MNRDEIAQSSIGIFDSGFGGLTVMRAVMDVLPNEHITYFGDTARLPYGEKSAETILRYSLENADFLMQQGIKLLIVACSTACSAALAQLQATFPIPVIGMVEPATEKMKQFIKSGNIAVLGTRRTIQSRMYQKQLEVLFPEKKIIAIPCPLFVPIVEEGYYSHPLAESIVEEYLAPLKEETIDAILLGCTHYPLLKETIVKQMGSSISLIDPAIGCAEYIRAFLENSNQLNPSCSSPHYRFFVSDDTEKFQRLGKIFLNHRIEYVYLKT